MKVALYHNLTSGGSKRELFEFTREFHRRGFTVDLYRPETANEEFLPLTPYIRRDRIYPIAAEKRINRRLPGLRKHLDVWGVRRTLRQTDHMARTIAADIDAEGYDFAFLHHDRIIQSPYVGPYLKTVSAYFCAEPMRRFYEPRIVRDSDAKKSALSRLADFWYRPSQMALDRYIRKKDRENLDGIDVLLTNSHYSNETIYRAYGRRASVVHLGVDTAKFQPGAETPPEKFILSVGAVAPLKGYDFLIRSVGLLPVEEQLPIVIVGNTASEKEVRFLKELAVRRGLELEFRVNVSEQELVRLYQTAWIYAYTPTMEPMGLGPLEALACGTPVVAVSEGGVRETMQCPGSAVQTERFESSFAAALSETIRRRNQGDFSSKAARAYILDYWTWPHACERMIQALRQTELLTDRFIPT